MTISLNTMSRGARVNGLEDFVRFVVLDASPERVYFGQPLCFAEAVGLQSMVRGKLSQSIAGYGYGSLVATMPRVPDD